MKEIISSALFSLLFVNILCAQSLYVGSNGEITTTPGEILYVGDDATIEATGSLTTTSDATKSGSLIVAGNTTGNIVYKRHLKDLDWHIISAPVTTQNIPSFIADNANDVLQSSSGTNNYAVGYYKNNNVSLERWVYHNTSPANGTNNQETLTDFDSGLGYVSKRASVGNYTFEGSMANQDVSTTIPKMNESSHKWSLIGNPYPSFLEGNGIANSTANLLKHNASKLDSSFVALYVWNGSEYSPINHTTGGAFKIAPGQGFMVNAKKDNQQFIFPKSLQTHASTATTFYRNTATPSSIILNLNNGTENKTTKLLFLENTSAGLDIGYDAGTFINEEPTLSIDTHLVSNSRGTNFTLQCLPPNILDTQLSIPLSVKAAENKTITFSINAASNVPQGASIYLEDTLHNTFTKLNENSYTTTLTNSENGIGRFYLRNSGSVLATDKTRFSSVNIYKNTNKNLRITGLELNNNTTLEMYSLLGKKVFTKQFVAKTMNDIALPENIATGIYLAKITTKTGEYNRKIILE